VPEVLLSGNHEEIRRWRRRAALEKTRRNRPELMESAELTEEDRKFLAN
jgi:tRNA (guanine37-N1)-methyltransferase